MTASGESRSGAKAGLDQPLLFQVLDHLLPGFAAQSSVRVGFCSGLVASAAGAAAATSVGFRAAHRGIFLGRRHVPTRGSAAELVAGESVTSPPCRVHGRTEYGAVGHGVHTPAPVRCTPACLGQQISENHIAAHQTPTLQGHALMLQARSTRGSCRSSRLQTHLCRRFQCGGRRPRSNRRHSTAGRSGVGSWCCYGSLSSVTCCSGCLVAQSLPVDLPVAQRVWAVPDMEQSRGVRADEHGEALLAGVPSADRFGVRAAVIAAVMTQAAEGPAGGGVVCRFSELVACLGRTDQARSTPVSRHDHFACLRSATLLTAARVWVLRGLGLRRVLPLPVG